MNHSNSIPTRAGLGRFEILSTIALAALACAGVLSLIVGVKHAILYGSHDLQWTGGQLLARHIDPWNERLANYPHRFQHFSPPNYLHLLYLLLVPFAGLSFHSAEIAWCVLSIGFSVGTVVLLARFFALSRPQALLVLSLLWMSSPFRVVLEVGQFSLVELFFFSLTFVAISSTVAGSAFGISLIKYSFSPIPLFLLLLRGRFRILLLAALISFLGLLGAWAFVTTPLAWLAREPFQVSRLAVSPGLADIMTLSEYALRPVVGIDRAKAVSYLLAILGSVVFAVLLSRYKLSRQVELTLVSVASLLLFKHLLYDYVFLVVPLCYALTLQRVRTRSLLIAGVLLFWFASAWLNRAANDLVVYLPGLSINFLLLASFLTFLTFVALKPASTKWRIAAQ